MSMLMAFSGGANALHELALMHAQSIDAYRLLLQWENLFVFTLLVPMVWHVQARSPTARRRATLVGGSVATFMALGGLEAPLIDAGIIETPYMISFAFLAIVVALSYELASNAVSASRYAKEIRANEQCRRSLLTDVQLAVIGVDPEPR